MRARNDTSLQDAQSSTLSERGRSVGRDPNQAFSESLALCKSFLSLAHARRAERVLLVHDRLEAPIGDEPENLGDVLPRSLLFARVCNSTTHERTR